MRPTFQVKQTDLGWERLRSEIERAGRSYAKVGILGTPKNQAPGPDGRPSNVKLGVILEYGAPKAGIPARHWLLGTFARARGPFVQQLHDRMSLLLQGKLKARQVLGPIARRMATDMRRRVRAGEGLLPLDPDTARQKRKTGGRLLYETGQLIRAISARVYTRRKRGGGRRR